MARPPSQAPSPVGTALRSLSVRRWLERRQPITATELARYLHPRLADLTQPDSMADRDLALDCITLAITRGETIVVFGDYDCDGMTSTAILTSALRSLGAAKVVPVLANRFDGGYGLSPGATKRVLAEKPGLVITCDCGSSDHPSLRQLRENQIRTVVIDHHLVPEEPLPVDAFLNPHRPECSFPYKWLASCGLALSVVAGLRAKLGAPLDVKRFLDLVAIGTIADVAPLTADNRSLTRAGLALLSEPERPGLAALMHAIGFVRGARVRAEDVSFRIAPRLNAPGRLGSPDIIVELLLTDDRAKAEALATEVERLCQARRKAQEQIIADAEKELGASAKGASAIVLGREGWNHGIVGIVAGRLADTHQLPTIVVGFENGHGRGSVRGPRGFPLFDAVQACESHLVRFGGHQAAVGVELKSETLDAFRQAFTEACRALCPREPQGPEEPLFIEPEDRLEDIFEDLFLLEPCGEQNPKPQLALEATVTSAREVRGGHAKLELQLPNGRRIGGFGPGLGALVSSSLGPGSLGRRTIVGDLREDTFAGGGALEFLVRSVRPGSEKPPEPTP